MNKRILMAIAAATILVAGMALIVSPGSSAGAQPETLSQPQVHTLIAHKNNVWPVRGRISVNPCALAECRDA